MSDNNENIGLILTMPRSGTWYINMFFWFYCQLLQGRTELELPMGKEKGAGTIHFKDMKKRQGIDLGIDELFIQHSACPGFHRYRGEYRQAWDELRFYVEGFNVAEHLIKISEKTDFDPTLNENVRIVYCSRYPLDQAVSFFRHMQNHNDPRHRYYVDSDGKERFIENVREYIFAVGLESYIKQYFTFKVMKQMCPDNILLIKYENLTRDPGQTFVSILDYFGHDIRDISNQQKIAHAMALSSKDSIKKIERTIGHSIGSDQADANESHIRGGETGKWKKHLNNDDREEIQERLARFGLSLDDFDTSPVSVEQIAS